MLDMTMFGLNTTGWLKESERSQREYLADTQRSIVQACVKELRAIAAGRQACGTC